MPEIDMSKLEDPEKLLAQAEEAEGKELKIVDSELPDEESEKIDEKVLDKNEDDGYTTEVEEQEEVKPASQEEDKAKKRGWKPLEEFQGDPNKWVDAEEFNRQTPLHETIAELSTRAKKTEKALNSLLKLFSNQEREITTNQIEEAKLLRDDAIRTRADPKLVDKFDAIIAEKSKLLSNPAIKYEEEKTVVLPHENIHPLAKAFVEKNIDWWYADDAESKAKVAYASAREEQLVKQLGDRIPKLYTVLEAEMSKRFGKAEALGESKNNDKKQVISRAPGAEGVTRNTGSSRSRTIGRSDLDSEDRDTYDVIKRSGDKEYLQLFLREMQKAGRLKTKG